MDDEVIAVCQGCGRQIDPDDASLVMGVEIVDLPGFQQTHDYTEGVERLFHPDCLTMAGPRWREASK